MERKKRSWVVIVAAICLGALTVYCFAAAPVFLLTGLFVGPHILLAGLLHLAVGIAALIPFVRLLSNR
jgi:hypothetical protein